jgi:gluconokinase
MTDQAKRVVVVTGVMGSGKSTLAAALARRLGWVFKEGDDLHDAANIAKMQGGIALTDDDRAPWLARVREWIAGTIAAGGSGVITCSALKRAYREVLRAGLPEVAFVSIEADKALLVRRLRDRQEHFVAADLLPSQLATYEPPAAAEGVLVLSAALPLERQIEAIVTWLSLDPGGRSLSGPREFG